MNEVILKIGREKSMLRRHPWIFSGAIERVIGNPQKGEIVKVFSSDKEMLGQGGYNPDSSIRIRIWTFSDETVDEGFFYNKMRIAINNKYISIPDSLSNSKRLIYGESDGIPGLIVDQYDNFLVTQFLTAGIDVWKDDIIKSLKEITNISNIYERSDLDIRKLEGLEHKKGLLSGEAPPNLKEIFENEAKFLVDIKNGQKTGFYLDQRHNRKAIRGYVNGKTVLNCFAYTGGFSVNALIGNASKVTSIESSRDAVDIAKENIALNQLDDQKCEWILGDVFQELRGMRDRDLKFDVIIMDPPKFAPTKAQISAASRGYKDINLLAFKLLNPGGILFTFSCSGGIKRDLFQKIVADAALDAGVRASILEYLSQDKDHPVALNFPESEYLKGLVCRII